MTLSPEGAPIPDEDFAETLIDANLMTALRVGQELTCFTYEITENDIRDFLIAAGYSRECTGIGCDHSRHSPLGPGATAPMTYFSALDPVERQDLRLPDYLGDIAFPQVGGGNANAFNEVRYERPFVVGDVITVTTKYTEVYEREGHLGRLLFRVRESHFRDAEGALVAVTRGGHVATFEVGSRKNLDGESE